MRRAIWLTFALITASTSGSPLPSPSPAVSRPAGSPSIRAPASATPPESGQRGVQKGAGGPGSCPELSGGGETLVFLKDIRVGTHPGYDRVTFEFVPGTPPAPAPPGLLPKYEVTKVASVLQDGSGTPLDVAGKAFFKVVFHGATGVRIDGEWVEMVYRGPRELKPSFPRAEVQDAGDFEGTLTWGLGLKQPACLKVTELRDPLRLAIDIPH